MLVANECPHDLGSAIGRTSSTPQPRSGAEAIIQSDQIRDQNYQRRKNDMAIEERMSFILSADTIEPGQTIDRILVPNDTGDGLYYLKFGSEMVSYELK